MQAGEVIRRKAYNALDALKGGRMNKLIKVNMLEIVLGTTEAYRKRRLKAIMDYARANCEFYAGAGGELSDFPVMQKMDYNANRDAVTSRVYKDRLSELAVLSTSGSTGVPFTVPADPLKMEHIFSNMLAVYGLNGFRFGMKRGEFRAWIEGKNTISKWKSFKNNLKMYDISNMGDDALKEICRRLEKEKIQVIVAYSSALTALADYMLKNGISPAKWSVEMIYSMGEAMPDATAEKLEKLFGFGPVRSYGNNENGFIAIALKDSKEYAVDLYNYYIEILKLDSDEPAEAGELGRIVVTDYYNRAFPMIRYDTGDTGKYVEKTDEDGRVFGTFTEIYGRRGSILYNTKGEPLSMHVFMNVLLKREGVVHQAQCIQWGEKEYEVLANYEETKITPEEVADIYRPYLGDDAEIRVKHVDEVPVQASGKRLVCVNNWK